MRTSRLILIFTILLTTAASTRADDADVLATLNKTHPRLLVTADGFTRARQLIKDNPTTKAWFDHLKQMGDKLLNAPVSQRVLIGPRLLQVSRQVLDRTMLLAGLYRLTGDQRYADRAKAELIAAANFVDWHPPHFLDVAEMTNAEAIGYDWLFDVLSPEERKTIRTAIIEKGLHPGLHLYTGTKRSFATITNNWNQVCNGGMIAGALAIADEEPDLARQIINHARKSLPLAFARYAPDGGCEEGPGYWSYAAQYTTYLLADLQNSLGTDFGFLKSPGFADCVMFRIQTIGPIGKTFNFADANEGITPAPECFWLARALDRPVYAAFERHVCELKHYSSIMDLLWYDGDGSDADIAALPKAIMFHRVNVSLMRSAWLDPTAGYVGFKGGDSAFSHSHLDLGSFVYDADGVRWALDLGPDDYNLPGYFGHQRYDYYRLRTEGHNTITLGTDNQQQNKNAPITAFSADANHPFAVVDLTQAYAPAATHVLRGVQLIGRQLLIQDEIEANAPIDPVWNFHTDAKIAIDPSGRSARLTHGKKTLIATILSSDAGKFAVISANPPPPQHQQPGVSNLVIRQPGKVKSLHLTVLLSPASEKPAKVDIQPLQSWIDAAPVK